MTPVGLVALRRAATLVHTLPGLRVRLRDHGRTLLEVARPPLPSGPSIAPCAFRMAVARAHVQLQDGARLAFLGLDEGTAPAVDIGVRSGDAALPGGIYRVAVDAADVHAFATTLTPRHCRDLVRAVGGPPTAGDIRLHHDAATEVTLVHTVSPRGMPDAGAGLGDLLAGFLADEVVLELAAVAP